MEPATSLLRGSRRGLGWVEMSWLATLAVVVGCRCRSYGWRGGRGMYVGWDAAWLQGPVEAKPWNPERGTRDARRRRGVTV